MGFTLIKGQFLPQTGTPDGDSVRFKPNKLELLENLQGVKAKISPATQSVQLRFEGIDAIEKAATKPLSVDAKNNMLALVGYDKTSNPTPDGYILTRRTDPNGRLVSFVFAGGIGMPDGSDVYIDATILGKSVNYFQMKDGYAYPLCYNTLFAELREKFNRALQSAKNNQLGYWVTDKSMEGIAVPDKASLATIDPVWPKLWRRCEEYLKVNATLDGFEKWLDRKNERGIKIDSTDETGLVDVLEIQGDFVRMLEEPENLMVVTKVKR
jgi:endonuclease YncB( thermonuclease family)